MAAKKKSAPKGGGHPSRGLTPDYSWRQYGNRVLPQFPPTQKTDGKVVRKLHPKGKRPDSSTQYNETMRQLTANKLPGSGYVKRYQTRKKDIEDLHWRKNVPHWYPKQSLGDLGYERAGIRIVTPRYVYGANPQTASANRKFPKRQNGGPR